MVKTITGDILNVKKGVIVHQTNFHGIMGAGVAAAIREKLLDDKEYRRYVHFCTKHGETLLGQVQYLEANIPGVVIANLFSQMDFVVEDNTLTSYTAMIEGLKQIKEDAAKNKQDVYIPYKIGCGIAGGCWPTVEQIINDVFGDGDVTAYIVRRRFD